MVIKDSILRPQSIQRLTGLKRFLAVACLLWPMAALAGDNNEDYFQRFRVLKKDDVAAHLTLARWCQDQEAWRSLSTQCRHILRIKPGHQDAQLLLDLANEMLGSPAGSTKKGPQKGGSASGGDGLPILTAEQVQTVRRLELDLNRPERVRLQYDRRLIRDFLDWVEGEDGFEYDRKTFARLPNVERIQLIMRHGFDRFADRITIRSDPHRMRTFIRQVWPIVARGCATSGCHGGDSAGALRLQGGVSIKTNAAYANFVILHDAESGGEQVINRNDPERSLLLTWGLPHDAGGPIAGLKHPTAIKPVYKGTEGRDYRVVYEWLRLLAIDRPDYGIDLQTKK